MERLKTMVILVLLAVIAGGAAWAATHNEVEVRINARQLDDGRVEFALQQRVDEEWGERILPRSRFFPANVEHNRWLNSTPMTVEVEVEAASELESESTQRAASVRLVPLGSIELDDDGRADYQTREDTVAGMRTSIATVERGGPLRYNWKRFNLICDHEDPDGGLWGLADFATRDGNTMQLARYDGERWRLGRVYDDSAVFGDLYYEPDVALFYFGELTWDDVLRYRWFSADLTDYDSGQTFTATFDLIRAGSVAGRDPSEPAGVWQLTPNRDMAAVVERLALPPSSVATPRPASLAQPLNSP